MSSRGYRTHRRNEERRGNTAVVLFCVQRGVDGSPGKFQLPVPCFCDSHIYPIND